MKKNFTIQPKEKSLKVLKALSAGINPITMEEFPPESVFENSAVTRALLEAAEALEFQIKSNAKTEKRLEKRPRNHGKKWTDPEREQLKNEFTEGGYKVAQIAKLHGRSTGSISSELERLGLIDPHI